MKLTKRKKTALGAFVILTVLSLPHEFMITKSYPPVNFKNKTAKQSIEDYEAVHGKTLESIKTRILQEYFTPYAFEQLKDIPVCEGRISSRGTATSMTCIEEYFGNWIGFGYGKRTIVNKDGNLKMQTIIHEYIHHASALGLIDDEEFEDAWQKMQKTSLGIADEIDRIIDEISTTPYRIWFYIMPSRLTLEREAYLSEYYLKQRDSLPKEMRSIYDKVLNVLPEEMRKIYEKTL